MPQGNDMLVEWIERKLRPGLPARSGALQAPRVPEAELGRLGRRARGRGGSSCTCSSRPCILGLLAGGVYALMASGLTLAFGIMRVINVAQGAMIILGAYLSYTPVHALQASTRSCRS